MALVFHPNPLVAGFWLGIIGLAALIFLLVFAFDGLEKVSNAIVKINCNYNKVKEKK